MKLIITKQKCIVTCVSSSVSFMHSNDNNFIVKTHKTKANYIYLCFPTTKKKKRKKKRKKRKSKEKKRKKGEREKKKT